MNTKCLVWSAFLSFGNASVLSVPMLTQEHSQWCWDASSTMVLQYYGNVLKECDVANFTKDSATWHDWGTTNCCTDTAVAPITQTSANFTLDTTGTCDYWNYNWGKPGSIQSILSNWKVSSGTVASYLSESYIDSSINAGRPFIIRLGWVSGGGHFIVGHGYDSLTHSVYINDPWPGNGASIQTYSSVVSNSLSNWTHTNTITQAPPVSTSSSSAALIISNLNVELQKADGQFFQWNIDVDLARLSDAQGRLIMDGRNLSSLTASSHLPAGFYLLHLQKGNMSRDWWLNLH